MRNDIISVSGDVYRYYKDCSGKSNPFKKLKLEDLPSKEGMKIKYGYDTSRSGFNLNPTHNWLKKQVGRNWDDVFSEASKAFRKIHSKALGCKLVDFLFWFVEKDVTMIDNVPHVIGRFMCDFSPVRGLYIHPVTNILCKAKKISSSKRKKEPVTFILIDRTVEMPDKVHPKHKPLYEPISSWYTAYEKIDGKWYKTIGYTTARVVRWETPRNRPVVKRQVNKKTLKKIGLTND